MVISCVRSLRLEDRDVLSACHGRQIWLILAAPGPGGWRLLRDRSALRVPADRAAWPRGCLFGQTVLEACVAELVHRPDDAQDLALTGILEKMHEPHGRMPAHCELHEGHRRRPGLSGEEHEH